MTDKELLELYSDYLISAFGQTTATGLSVLLDGQLSHDRLQQCTATDLWQIVKPHMRSIQCDDGVLILDDSIVEKLSTDENDIICLSLRLHPGQFNQRHQLSHRTLLGARVVLLR